MVIWPCLLKLDGDDELIYLGSEQDLVSECDELMLTDEDFVLDANGARYFIETHLKEVRLVNAEQPANMREVILLIRSHEFKKVSLCLTKIHFETISDAIHSLNY